MKFKIGDKYIRTDAYGGMYEMTVIDRTDDTVTFEEYMIGGRYTKEFEIEIDDGRRYGTEYVNIGKWKNVSHYIYAE